MHVVVTGGAGYVGSRLVPTLLDAGHRVTVVDKLHYGAEGLDAVRERIELVALDVRAVPPERLRGVDAVVHLAGLSNDPTAEFDAAANRAVNLDATLDLARKARDAGVSRFVFASSCSVYFRTAPTDELLDESHPVAPTAPYSWSKRQAEIGLLELARPGFCVTCLRKGTVYGQSPRMRYDLVVNAFVRDAFAKRRLTVHAGGRMWRPMLHVEEAARAYVAVLEAAPDAVEGRILNVLSDNHQVLDLAREVRRGLERRKGVDLELDVQQVGVARTYRVDGRRFRERVGLPPGPGVAEAASEMWDHLDTGIAFDHPIYENIRWLELLSEMQRRLAAMGGSPF